MAVFRFRSRFFAKPIHCKIWLLIFTLLTPVSFMGAGSVQAAPDRVYTSDNPVNAHIMRRWNSPERARAVEEAARIDAAAREEFARSEAAAAAAPMRREARVARPPAPAAKESVAANDTAPKSMTEVLFNYGAGFMGVPGLASRQGIDGSLDEGLGFHQDGTARKAGGVTGASGPSGNGARARSYMQSGLSYNQGYSGLYAEMYNDLWGRNDPTRGGRITGPGSNSGGYSRELGDFDPMNMAVERGLNWGAGFLNSMGEAGISSLVDGGRASLNFHLDKDGYFGGEGDALLPWYDGKYTTIYTQLGARSMHDSSDTRWIGNFGLGQRWFPLAEGESLESVDYDAGQLMLGYNAFFDYDFTRDHQRGGLGVEAQWDWLRLSSNYYFPLSEWKKAEDFTATMAKERPAKGWDARVKAYLPFYRNVALTGAYSQWYGDNVAMYGADGKLEKDPKVWSYGVEYTPIPLVSGFVTQRSTERGRTDTEFGLNFTYHFGMPWEQQTSHAKVAELRTVGGSRHEFVDRENRIILEYKAKSRSGEQLSPYTITIAGFSATALGALSGTATVLNRADNTPVAGQSVTLVYKTSGGTGTAVESTLLTAMTDANGEIDLSSYSINPTPRNVIVAAQIGSDTSSWSAPQAVNGGAPASFLTGPSLDDSGNAQTMTWAAAGQYCANNGGRLPRIQNADLLYDPSSPNDPKLQYPGGSVDGFGSLDGSWPGTPFPTFAGSNDTVFWTGTVDGDFTDYSWIVDESAATSTSASAT